MHGDLKLAGRQMLLAGGIPKERIPDKEKAGIIPNTLYFPADFTSLKHDKLPGRPPKDLHFDTTCSSTGCSSNRDAARIPGGVAAKAEQHKLDVYWKRLREAGIDLASAPRLVPMAVESGGRMGEHLLAFLGEFARFSQKKSLRRCWIQKISALVHLKFADYILTACAIAESSSIKFSHQSSSITPLGV